MNVWLTSVAVCYILITVKAIRPVPTECGLLMNFPKTMLTNRTEKLCVTTLGVSEYIRVDMVYTTQSCRVQMLEWSGEENDVCLDLPTYCQSNFDDSLEVIRTGTANLYVFLMGRTTNGEHCSKYYEETVNLLSELRQTFIQTDKPMYQPGQKVQFRVLSLSYPDMKPYIGETRAVWITSPGGTRLRQWTNPTSTDGLLDLDFELASEPELGRWTIHVDTAGVGATTQTFEVDEYVLPKFEVTINTPSYIYVKETGNITINVCAKYTYGQPVRGSVIANITVKNPNPETWRYHTSRPILERVMDADDSTGCAEFQVPASDLDLDNRRYRAYSQKLIVGANFTESGTDVSMTAMSSKTPIAVQPVQLTINGPEFFKPGLPYRGQVSVTLPDGAPAAPHEVTVSTSIASQRIVRTVTTENGVATFELPTPQESSVTSLTISAQFTESTEAQYITPRDGSIRYHHRRTSKSLKAWYSPSGSFLDINPIRQLVHEGEEVPVQLRFTVPDRGNINEISFYYRVVSRGRIISNGQHQWINQNASQSDLPDVPVEVQLPRGPNRFRRRSMPYFPRRTEEIAPELPTYPQVSVEQVQFSFEASTTMSPISRLVVYHIRDDREIVTASTEFKVAEAFENKVSVQFTEGREVRPGQPATVSVSAAPNSLCAVGVVDKSVHIMGGNNQLTKSKVFGRMHSFNSIVGYPSTECPATEEEEQPMTSSRDFYETKRSRHIDGAEGFRTAGLAVMTDLELETRPCWRRRQTVCRHCFGFDEMFGGGPHAPIRRRLGMPGAPDPMFGEPLPIMVNARPVPMFKDLSDPVAREMGPPEPQLENLPDTETTPEPVVELRHYFPETWLWKLTRTGDDGTHTSQQDIPHTVTDWVASAFCLSAEQGVGLAEPVSIRAFQPFFLSYTLPYSVIRGEKVPVKVTVFNYLSECLRIQVSLSESTNFTIATRPEDETLEVCGNMAETIQYEIVPTELGDIPIRVDARSDEVIQRGDVNEVDVPYEFPLTDAIEDTILVEPEGSEREETFSELICPEDNEDDLYWKMIPLTLPSTVVPGSARGRVQVIGDVMGPVMSNLDSLLRMPTGCGEQNMILMAPNIYVMQYLSHTNQLTTEIEEKAMKFMRAGYQRELQYQLRDASYSAFGQSDGVGSTWLTAFVLKCFAQAQDFMDIDTDNLSRTSRWLLQSERDENGCIVKRGRVIHTEMQGDVSGPATMTAFVTIALLEAGASPVNPEVTRGLQCIKHWFDTTNPEEIDTYTLAISSYAFGLGEQHTVQSEVISMLEERVTVDGDTRYWSNGEEEDYSNCFCICHPQISGVEMTSYALLGFLNQDADFGDKLLQAMPVVRWLNSQRNALGGFSSTQDTVVGLQALSQFAGFLFNPNSTAQQLSIEVNATRAPPHVYREHNFVVNSNNRLVLQREDLAEVPTELSVTGRGSGCALFQAELRYNIPVPGTTTQPLFDIEVLIGDGQGNTVAAAPDMCGDKLVRICIRYTGNAAATNMAVVEMKMISGYVPHEESLQEYHRKNGESIGLKRIDKFEKGKPLALYFDQFDDTVRCFEVTVKQQIVVKDAKEAFVKVYDYYKPDLSGYRSYNLCETVEE